MASSMMHKSALLLGIGPMCVPPIDINREADRRASGPINLRVGPAAVISERTRTFSALAHRNGERPLKTGCGRSLVIDRPAASDTEPAL